MKILVVAPFMHLRGHYSVFPRDVASGFSSNGAQVTLLFPFSPPEMINSGATTAICLVDQRERFGAAMKLLWKLHSNRPIMLCLDWLMFHVRPGVYDLVYWSDFEADNQQSTWPIAIASRLGWYRHRTAFTEHHNFSWSKHRWQRLFWLDRWRLSKLSMFVHSRRLLNWIRTTMKWHDVGHYVAHGLLPNPASEADREAARSALKLAPNARVLLVFGMQAIRRKGIDVLAAAIRDLPLDKPLVVLFAGMKVRDEVHPFDDPALLSKPLLRIVHHDSFIPDAAVKAFFAAADAVWASYGNFLGASGVLAQAIAYGRLALCTGESEGGDLCHEYHIGLATRADTVEGTRAMLCEFMTLSPTQQHEFEDKTRNAAQQMTWPVVARQILQIVCPNTPFAGNESIDALERRS